MKRVLENKIESSAYQIADNFVFNTIVSVDELMDHDMIYIYHHLKIGSQVNLSVSGTNVKGNLRFSVSFKGFTLGYITLDSVLQTIYKDKESLEGVIIGLEKQKFLPIKAIDLSLKATKMRMVS